jgi:hypothetical protein
MTLSWLAGLPALGTVALTPWFCAPDKHRDALEAAYPSVPMKLRHRPAGSLPLRAEVAASNGYARFD